MLKELQKLNTTSKIASFKQTKRKSVVEQDRAEQKLHADRSPIVPTSETTGDIFAVTVHSRAMSLPFVAKQASTDPCALHHLCGTWSVC